MRVCCFALLLAGTVRVDGLSVPRTAVGRAVASSGGASQQLRATPATEPVLSETTFPAESTDAVVCGGGPTGLLTAIMLAQRDPATRIQVFDRLDEPLSPTDGIWNDLAKFYLIGLGGRGQTSLQKFGLWEEVQAACTAVVGRRDWAPGSEDGVERIFDGRKFTTQVLPRDKLVGVLYQHIQKNYADRITLNYGYEVTPSDFDYENGSKVLVSVSRCNQPVDGQADCDTDAFRVFKADLLVAADGTSRTIANQMEEADRVARKKMNPIQKLRASRPFRVKRYVDDNQRIYKTIPLNMPADWRHDLNYSARSAGGRVNLDALPANRNGGYCGVLLLFKDDDMAQPNVDPKAFRAFLEQYLPQFTPIMDDDTIEQVAKKPPSFLPSFRYVGPRLNQGKRTLLLGDCAHTVKPYFGLGANTAMEDVKVLSNILDTTDSIPEAVQEFSRRRARESKTLVRISRSLDRPGAIGTVTFLIPIILDSIFNKIAPAIFSPNVISMLQKDDMTFQAVARKKRLDRLLQVSIIGGVLAGMTKIATVGVRLLAKALGRNSTTVAAGLFAAFVSLAAFKRISKVFRPGMAPADVLAKTKSRIGDNDIISAESVGES